MKKRYWLAILCAALVLAVLLPFTMRTANAEVETSGQCGDDLYWEFDEETGTLTIIGRGDMYDYYGWNTPWYDVHESIISAVLPDGITHIGSCAFNSCTGLTSITIPDSVTSIGNDAFSWCPGLTTITIPDSLTDIGNDAFCNCSGMTEYIVSPGNPAYCTVDGVLMNRDKNVLIQYPIGNQRTEYTIPDSVTKIGDDAFRCCHNLTSISFPDSLRDIGDGAFDAVYLTAVTIPNGVTSIGADAFRECRYLASVFIPESVTEIGYAAFGGCYALTEITISDANNSFVNADGVLFTADRTRIVAYPAGKADLTYIIPDGTVDITEAFRECSNLKIVTIPDSVTSIGSCAFIYCSRLASINLPVSVTTIESGAFGNCPLTDVYYGGTEEQRAEIEIGEWWNDTLLNAEWHYNSIGPTEIADNQCGSGLYWSFDGETGTLTITGSGAMWNYERETSPWYDVRQSITSVVLPEGLTTIGEYAFGSTAIMSIVLPDSLQRIGSYAFRSCRQLTAIHIPQNVSYIGSYAFTACDCLTAITVSGENEHFCSVDGVLFTADRKTLVGYPTGNQRTAYEIPEGTVYIADNAFYNCSNLITVLCPEGLKRIGRSAFGNTGLTSVCLPVSVTTIDRQAFNNCRSLTEVYYAGSEDDRAQINIDNDYDGNEPLLNATWHYNGYGPDVEPTASGQCGENLWWSFYESTGKLTITGSGAMWDFSYGETPWFDIRGSIINIMLPDGMTRIGMNAFSYCNRLTDVNIPGSVIDIGAQAFSGCSRLNIDIPNGIESIGRFAFSECALDDITIPASVTLVGDGAFFGCKLLAAIKVDVHNQAYQAIDGVLFAKDGTELIAYPAGKQDSLYIIPDGVLIIQDNACNGNAHLSTVVFPDSVIEIGFQSFASCANLKEISIGGSVTTIRHMAFINTGLQSVRIPSNVIQIVGSAFATCSSLTAIDVDPNNQNYTSVDGTLFSKDQSTLITYPKGKSEHCSVPNGTTVIGNFAFYYNELLTSIYIPKSVTNIERYAFFGNYALTDVYYGGSEADREEMLTIEANNNLLEEATWHYALEITTQPKSVTVANGKTAKFTVKASESGVKYQWYYSTNNGTSWKKYSDKTSASLSVKASATNNGYLYRCEITKDDVKATSKNAKLTVSGVKPKIVVQPKKTTVAVGETATFKVVAAGSGLKYQWYYSKDNGTKWTKWSGKTKSSVTVTSSASNNGTLYRCVVSNTKGSVTSSNVRMTVSGVKPRILTQPKAVTVKSGKTAKFTVAAAGVNLTYQWYYSKNAGKTWTKWSGKTSATLSFKSSKAKNNYLYRCVVTNEKGSVTSKNAKLTVK